MSHLAALTWGRYKAGSLPCRKLVIIAVFSCPLVTFSHAYYGRRECSLHRCIRASTVPSIKRSGETVRSLEQWFFSVLPIALRDRKVKLEAKGTVGPKEQNCSTEGQNSSSEVSQTLIRGRFFSGHSGALRTKTSLQVSLSSFLPVAKGHAFDVDLFYKSQIFHSWNQQRSYRK